jgi:hypothetical protein
VDECKPLKAGTRAPHRAVSAAAAGTAYEVSIPPYTHGRVYPSTTRKHPEFPSHMLLASKVIAWLRLPAARDAAAPALAVAATGTGMVGVARAAAGRGRDGEGDVKAARMDARIYMCAEATISAGVGGVQAGGVSETVGTDGTDGRAWAMDEGLRFHARRLDVAERLWALPAWIHTRLLFVSTTALFMGCVW